MRGEPMTVTSREITARDFLIFQVKLALDGLKDFVVFNMSIGAIVLDFIAGRGRRPRLFYSVVRISERFENWLDLHSVVARLDAADRADPALDGEVAGADALIGEIEQLVRRHNPPEGPPGTTQRPGEGA